MKRSEKQREASEKYKKLLSRQLKPVDKAIGYNPHTNKYYSISRASHNFLKGF
jgi:hypothetical protein